MIKILFITWDGPQTNYLEGLFLPIFNAIAGKTAIEFHVIQFTWAAPEKTRKIAQQAGELGISYTAYPIHRKIQPVLGSLYTAWVGKSTIKSYVNDHHIDVVMPRSTFPALMTNWAKLKKVKIVFDADGFPLEERLAFSGLKPKSLQYRFLKAQEISMLKNADQVLVRSKKSIAMHADFINGLATNKFHVVANGRDSAHFKPDPLKRMALRNELGFAADEKVFVYCGSLGPQYVLEEMLDIFIGFQKLQPSKFLILTGDRNYAESILDNKHAEHIKMMHVPYAVVPDYLVAADIAFALRIPGFSMQGVAPIKLGEYLLMGLPTIASLGIGDTETILADFPDCLLYDHLDQNRSTKAVNWLMNQKFNSNKQIRAQALEKFSLTAAATSYIKAFEHLG